MDLPEGMPREVMDILKKARVAGKKLGLRPLGQKAARKDQNHKRGRKHHRKGKKV